MRGGIRNGGHIADRKLKSHIQPPPTPTLTQQSHLFQYTVRILAIKFYCGYRVSPRCKSDCVLKLSEEDTPRVEKLQMAQPKPRRDPDPVTALFYRHLCPSPMSQSEEELVSQEEMSSSLTTRQTTMQDRHQWRAGPHLAQHCLAMHTSYPLFSLSPVSALKNGSSGRSLDIWAPLLSAATLNKSPFLTFHCHLSL